MTRVGVAQLKMSLSSYLARVKSGEVVTITEHGRPIAQISPFNRAQDDSRAYLEELERQGLVKMGTGKLPDDFWDMERPVDPEGRSLAYVLEEREHGW